MDPAIFGAGSLCEFSRRFRRKDAVMYLRHDGFNGREVGATLAHALLRTLDPVNGDVLASGAAQPSRSRVPSRAFRPGTGSQANVSSMGQQRSGTSDIVR